MTKNDYITHLEQMKNDLEETEKIIHKDWQLCVDLLADSKSEEEKDCSLTFTDGRPPYMFSSSTPLKLVLDTITEKKLPVLAIHTPGFVLSLLDEETYEIATSEDTFSDLGV